jgi:hypothetical protein
MPSRREKRRDKLEDRLFDVIRDSHSQVRGFTLCLQPADAKYLKEKYSEYTYKFQPAPFQKDRVLHRIRDAIVELKGHPEHGVLMCNHNIRVAHSTDAPPLWLIGSATNDVKFYTFFQDEQEFPATAPVSIIPPEGPLTLDKIHVREGGKWVSLKEWLIKLADDSILDKRNASSIDYFWRKRSGKVFRLMDLPVELRLMIFERIVAPGGEVYPLSKMKVDGRPRDETEDERKNSYITLGLGYHAIFDI